MASVRTRADSGLLMIDFRYRGVRYRELTALNDTPTHRKRVEALARRIQKDIDQGVFEYALYFPSSPKLEHSSASSTPHVSASAKGNDASLQQPNTPSFAEFAHLWFVEMSPQWRQSHCKDVRAVLDNDLLPFFGKHPVHIITKADVMAFRAMLSKRPGRKSETLSAARINKIMCFLRQVLNEAADRHEFVPAFRGIKPLRQARTEVQPFSLEEVQRILDTVRSDYRDYLTVRFFTGMRSGEINGLQWKHVDLERNLILVRESLVGGEQQEALKSESSWRDIAMLPMVRTAIENRLIERQQGCEWVFTTSAGNPIDTNNFSNRVWYPLLRYLGFKKRRPYQTRHTAATLMLAAGESPEWIARMLGHSTTEMLFKVYSRFVPNLTRNDGQAFAGLVHSRIGGDLPQEALGLAPLQESQTGEPVPDTSPSEEDGAGATDKRELLNRFSPDQLAALLTLARQIV